MDGSARSGEIAAPDVLTKSSDDAVAAAASSLTAGERSIDDEATAEPEVVSALSNGSSLAASQAGWIGSRTLELLEKRRRDSQSRHAELIRHAELTRHTSQLTQPASDARGLGGGGPFLLAFSRGGSMSAIGNVPLCLQLMLPLLVLAPVFGLCSLFAHAFDCRSRRHQRSIPPAGHRRMPSGPSGEAPANPLQRALARNGSTLRSSTSGGGGGSGSGSYLERVTSPRRGFSYTSSWHSGLCDEEQGIRSPFVLPAPWMASTPSLNATAAGGAAALPYAAAHAQAAERADPLRVGAASASHAAALVV